MIPHELHARSLADLLAPIAPLLADDAVGEIMINGPARVYVERAGRIEPTTALRPGADELEQALELARQAGLWRFDTRWR